MPDTTQAAVVQQIPVDKAHLHPRARTHNADKLTELIGSVKERGQLQAARGRPKDGSIEIYIGAGRYQACKALGKLLDVIVTEKSDEEVDLDMLHENLKREDLDPITEAKEYDYMMKTHNWNQEEVGQKVGKDQTTIARALSLLKLPDDLQGFMTRVIKGEGHTRHLKKVTDPNQRISLTKQVESEGLSVKETEKRVKQLLGKAPSPSRHPGEGRGPGASKTLDAVPHLREYSSGQSPVGDGLQSAGMTSPPDPLANFWPQVMNKSQYLAMNYARWGVSYGRHEIMKTGGGKGVAIPAWNFWFSGGGPVPKAELKRWFLALADAMGDTREEEDRFNKVVATVMPKDKEEFMKMTQEGYAARLPQTPEEQAELEKLAAQSPSPGPVYAKILGADSIRARRMSTLTWEAMGIKDPVAGCRQIVEGMRKVAEIQARNPLRTPDPTPHSPKPTGRDAPPLGTPVPQPIALPSKPVEVEEDEELTPEIKALLAEHADKEAVS
jgi:ParB/RepB/Spo0J family partition protein